MKNLLLIFFLLSLGFSQSKVSIQDKEIEINQNEAVVEVLEWFVQCALLELVKVLQKLILLIKSKFTDGVSVDIDAQFVQLGLLESTNINPEKIVQVIEELI